MTEQKWLTSTNPQAMLRWLTKPFGERSLTHPAYRLSDRHLMMFTRACCYAVSASLGEDADLCIEHVAGPARNPTGWARAWAGDQQEPTAAARAGLLRHILGNPWRPGLTRECKRCDNGTVGDPYDRGVRSDCRECDGKGWLPVELPGLTCPKCEGEGSWPDPCPRHDDHNPTDIQCRDCKGTGRIVRFPGPIPSLAAGVYNQTQYVHFALADALEEVGYPELSAHFRDEPWHPKGCWALDLILGKEDQR